ncbi:MAG: DUF2029 domain-containing protein [Legionellaceae bacterium]|nr:DUF2029 domain-containing protein [Legionellaceae bacterium]
MAKLRPYRHWEQSVAVTVMLMMYALLIGLLLSDRFYVDFSSLYIAIKTVWLNDNPYRVLMTDYLPVAKQLPANLNPPFTLLLLSPFHYLPFHWALMIYFFSAIALGLVGAFIGGQYFLAAQVWRQHRILLLLFYSSLFSVFMGIAIAQLGAPLFCLMMLGYHGYQQHQEKAAAFFWGMAIALKLFPGVVLFFCWQQRRYRLSLLTGAWAGLLSSTPLLFYRTDLYALYLAMMRRVMWYGDSWNASLYGFIMRLCIRTENTDINLLPYQIVWFLLAVPILFFYLNSRRLRRAPARSFAVALVLMLLLSPFGWIYYFALLVPAWAMSYTDALKRGLSGLLLWFAMFVLCNVPIDYVIERLMEDQWHRLSLYSLHGYGLLLLLWLLYRPDGPRAGHRYGPEVLYWPLYWLQLLSMLVVISILAYRL